MKPHFVTQKNLTLLKKFGWSLIVIIIVGISISILFDALKNNQDIRTRASGFGLGSKLLCNGNEVCSDGRCIGETWRECKPCPSGKARAVYKVSCEGNEYSKCTFNDSVCND